MQVGSLSTVLGDGVQGAYGVRKSPSASFLDDLKTGIKEVDAMQHQADQVMQDSAVKGAQRIDETMIKLEEAEISLRLMVKMRNKALEAYQEVMRMQF
ncbi:MAG: flagellar hook-basal body complex protein FliE [Syntrophobacteraceae bacterium]